MSEIGFFIFGIIGLFLVMEDVYWVICWVVWSNVFVFFFGEMGIGKELIVFVLYCFSNWGSGLLVKVNCGVLSESLFESELFGYVCGVFIGVVGNCMGCFEVVYMGIIFLDEINLIFMFL